MFAPERYRPIKTLALFSVLAMGACGKNPAGPSAPSPSGAPAQLSVSHVSYVDQSVRFAWVRPNEISTYAIEIGASPGATARTVLTGDNGDFEVVSNLSPGETFARVRTRFANGELSGPSNEVRFFVVDIRDFVQALFLSAGPYQSKLGCSGGALCDTSTVLGFPRGTTIRARAWSGFNGANLDALRAALSQASEATGGAINTTFELTDDTQPSAGTNEISFGLMSSTNQCGGGAEACVNMSLVRTGVIRSARAWFSATFSADPLRTSSFAHEVAHGVLGLRHLDSESVGGDQASIMSTRPGGTIGLPSVLTPLDFAAVRWVYEAGFGGGSTAGELRASDRIH